MRDNRINLKNYFFETHKRREIFIKNTTEKITRKVARKHLAQLHLACELVKVIRHFFPDLLPMLKNIMDPRNQSYITYQNHVLLMTRILSSIFYISSMRKTSEEFNSERMIENIGYLCEQELLELPYWETINNYLEKLEPQELQDIVSRLVRRLLRSRAFESARVRGKYWQVILDGTQLESSRKELDPKSLYRVHNRGTEKEYTEYYYYVLEAKIVLHENILVSIMTEFVENEGEEMEKQDCERNACRRLMERLKKEFPRLPICISADSLYACESFFRECKKKSWRFLLRFKKGSIPIVHQEYMALKGTEKNRQKKSEAWYDYVNGIAYGEYLLNYAEYGESSREYPLYFLTGLPATKKNVESLVSYGRRRWDIENQGFHTQKRQGYYLEHMYSRNYQAMKNHYYLIQIGHMISQVIEAWKSLWEKVRQSREQKHRRILESFKWEKLKEQMPAMEEKMQIRFE